MSERYRDDSYVIHELEVGENQTPEYEYVQNGVNALLYRIRLNYSGSRVNLFMNFSYIKCILRS